MSDDNLKTTVQSTVHNLGFKVRILSFERLHALRDEILGRYAGKESDAELQEYIQAYLNRYIDFSPPAELPYTKAIIIVAAPHKPMRAKFHLDGQSFEAIVPPTYTSFTDKAAYQSLSFVLHPLGYKLINALLPKKLMAARTGLAKYGKNNISYVDGMGSFPRLEAFYTNAPLEEDAWIEPQMLDACQNCEACIKKCPTGAITGNQFQIDAHRCLTTFNEQGGPFPDWIDPEWHTCFVGCMECQNICPENKDLKDNVEHVADFTAEETRLILNDTPIDDLPRSAYDKLCRFDMHTEYAIVPRNVNALVENLNR